MSDKQLAELDRIIRKVIDKLIKERTDEKR